MSAYDFIDTLAVQILTYKKEHNETAAQFAKGCGVSAATIRRIENGDANVKLSTADKLLRYMNITLIDLLPPLAIGEELGMSPKAVRHRILRIKVGLKWYLAVDLDVPALFN